MERAVEGELGQLEEVGDALDLLEGLERVGVILSGGNADLDHLPW